MKLDKSKYQRQAYKQTGKFPGMRDKSSDKPKFAGGGKVRGTGCQTKATTFSRNG